MYGYLEIIIKTNKVQDEKKNVNDCFVVLQEIPLPLKFMLTWQLNASRLVHQEILWRNHFCGT